MLAMDFLTEQNQVNARELSSAPRSVTGKRVVNNRGADDTETRRDRARELPFVIRATDLW